MQNIFNKLELDKLLIARGVTDLNDFNQLIGDISKEVIETLLNGELTSFLGYNKYEQGNNKSENSRNGFTPKKVQSNYGTMNIEVPRDRKSEFEPQLVKKKQREISFFDKKVIALYAKGLSTRDISTYVDEVYNYKLSPETISVITDGVSERALQWQNRALDALYPIVFLDGFYLKIRVEGHVRNVAVYSLLGINMDGRKECLGIWIGGEAESAKYWLSVLTELKNRGLADVLIFCVDNLTGISNAIETAFPQSEIQKCIVHQIRNSLKCVSYKEKAELAADLKTIYKAATEDLALSALTDFGKKWDKKYPHVAASWQRNWLELSTFFKYPQPIRRLIYTTNPIESMNRGFRKITKTKSVFPSQESAFKLLFLVTEAMNKKWNGRIKDWAEIISHLLIYFKEIVDKHQI